MTLPPPSPIPISRLEANPRSAFVRRQEASTTDNSGSANDAYILALALIGLFALGSRRSEYDSWTALIVEFSLGVGLLWGMFASRKGRYRAIAIPVLGTAIVLMPWIVNQFARSYGSGNDVAILMLTNLAWGGGALALSSRAPRTQNLSVVCSGFLTLFAVFTADSPEITLIVYLWMAVCLWWLVSRHWAGVSTLHAAKVHSSISARMLTICLGCGSFVLAILLISDSVPVLRKLQAEIAPTSGGTSLKDKSARRGVGNGEALIAAKNHATSFGPVETDFFLNSPKPSLFDVISEEFGEPFKKNKVERAQALTPDEVRSYEGDFSEANRNGGDEFSIERDSTEVLETQEDLSSNALMFFEGRTGIRLAVQRYDSFEDNRWKKSKKLERQADTALPPVTMNVEDDLWFAPPGLRIQSSLSPFVSSIPEAIRFTRYGDNSIPAALGMQLWRIDALTQADFFAYTGDNCLYMPGREAVPDYTVVRFVNSQLDAEKLHEHMRTCSPGRSHLKAEDSCQSQIAKLAHRYAEQQERGLEEVQAIVEGLRRDFTVSKTVPQVETLEQGALASFLRDRRGPSYLFATTAALMLDHIGYDTRLVTGFYVNPEHYDNAENATAILPEDVHCWIEVNSGHGHWVPFEPTPGFRAPPVRSTWVFWWSQNWKSVLGRATIAGCLAGALYVLRGWVFNAALFVLAPLFRLLPPSRRLASLRALLDLRWKLIGSRRPECVTPRRRLTEQPWGLNDSQRVVAMEFFDAYDVQRFGVCDPKAVCQTVLARMPGIIRSVKSKRQSKQPSEGG